MRILFVKGKQRSLIKEFKTKNQFTWNEFSDFLGVKFGRLMAYYYETSLLSEEIYEKLDLGGFYKKFILEKMKDNWGRSKGGSLSPGRTKKIELPKESIGLAEFYGIMLGDGNSHKTKRYKIGTYMIRIVGDAKLDRKYHLDYVKPLIERLFAINVRVGSFKPTTIFLEAHSRELIDFLEKKGFKPGNKIKNELGIPDWIKNNRNFLMACLRGLYDTDGSIYKLGAQNCYQIDFCNHNPILLRDVRNSLVQLGIKPSKISKNKDVYITKKSELRKFLKLIGFANHRHLRKVEMFDLAP